MSAFIVSHNLIDVLLTFASDKRLSYYVKDAGKRVDINRQAATEIGRILLTENERSVYHRYDDIDAGSDNKPGTHGEDAQTYGFKRWPHLIDAVSVLKACSCFDYQACETDDYETSLAHDIVDAIRHGAIRSLPSYDAISGWDDFTRETKRRA